MSVTKLHVETGCWIDGHWGWRGIARVVEIARLSGMKVYDEEIEAYDAFVRGEDRIAGIEYLHEFMTDWADAAEVWLNENVAPVGTVFHWHDGEFFLSTDEDIEELAW